MNLSSLKTSLCLWQRYLTKARGNTLTAAMDTTQQAIITTTASLILSVRTTSNLFMCWCHLTLSVTARHSSKWWWVPATVLSVKSITNTAACMDILLIIQTTILTMISKWCTPNITKSFKTTIRPASSAEIATYTTCQVTMAGMALNKLHTAILTIHNGVSIWEDTLAHKCSLIKGH